MDRIEYKKQQTHRGSRGLFRCLYPREVCLLMTAVAGLCLFVPLWMGYDRDDDVKRISFGFVNWDVFYAALVASFSTALPMTLDTVLDYQLPLRTTLPRYLMIFSLVLPGVLSFASYSISQSYDMKLVLAGIHLRETLLRGSLLSFLMCDDCSWKANTAVGCVWSLIMLELQTTMWGFFRPDVVSYSWRMFVYTFTPISLFLVLGMLVYRLRKTFYMASKSTKVIHFPTFYTALFVLCISIKICVLSITKDMAYSGFSDIFICILATSIPGRQARHEKTIAQMVLESKRDYVSYISHEIRTPLNSVYMGIQLLSKEWGRDFKSVDVGAILGDIDDSCKVAIDILNELLLVNKLETGNIELEKELIVAVDLIKNVTAPFSVQARQKGVEYNFTGDSHVDPILVASDTHVCVDTRKISQVLRNLVSNALKFTPKGGRVDVYSYLTRKASPMSKTLSHPPHSIQPSATQCGKTEDIPNDQLRFGASNFDLADCKLRIEVHDTGVGISPDNMQRLFGEIVQFNASKLQNGGGSGIGLWISKKIMDLHGGRIGVRSELGKGSMFFVEMDVATNVLKASRRYTTTAVMLPSLPMRSSSSEYIQEIGNDSIDGTKVLVVDDSTVNRKMMKRLLGPKVGQLCEAENGIKAVAKVHESIENGCPYDVIFMDANMPEMCGTDATVLIRDMGYNGMIIFLTGNVLPEEYDRIKSAGADEVIIKPCTLDRLEYFLEKCRK